MKQLFAYIRVSTLKQGKGVSLEEQRVAIQAYADRVGAVIVTWFEEKRTAAKAGRPEFTRMVKLLRRGEAEGVVIHKVDRSTRNFRDWAEIDELLESGIEVHFANETLDLHSRGGRLAADVQVVVAVDYIRNLREEALKGIHGRLKQGILPHHAPLGYLDRGAGKPKDIDPVRGPLVHRLFETYATGVHTLRDVTVEAAALGLRNTNGNLLRLTQIHRMLRNVFYAGIIKSARFGLFPGAHEPLVRRALFDRVQEVLSGKFVRRTKRHFYLFRRLLRCDTCSRSLIGSMAKGNVYYRCSTSSCPTTSVREDSVEAEVRDMFGAICLGDDEANRIEAEVAASERGNREVFEKRRTALTEALAAANARIKRLTALLLDEKIDPAAHDEARAELVLERQKLEQELAVVNDDHGSLISKTRTIVELARSAAMLYELADDDRKRQLLEIMMSNCRVSGKTIAFTLREPFATISKRERQQRCRPYWDTGRTLSAEEMLMWSQDWPEELVQRLDNIGFTGKIQAAP